MNAIEEKLQTTLGEIGRYQKEAARLLMLNDLLKDVDLSDVSHIYTYETTYNGQRYELTLYLKEEAKDSHLPHKLCQKFGIQMSKSKSYDKDSLVYTGDVNTDEFRLRIQVY